jgi:hypothetical protein
MCQEQNNDHSASERKPENIKLLPKIEHNNGQIFNRLFSILTLHPVLLVSKNLIVKVNDVSNSGGAVPRGGSKSAHDVDCDGRA